MLYKWQDPTDMLQGFTDSDWAGCTKTRRSTSGGVLLHGHRLVHHRSSTQAVVALSSMEAELNAIVKGVAEIIGLKNIVAECGRGLRAIICTDSSAANGAVNRQGCGKVKHLDCRQLWFTGKVYVKKVSRNDNPSDTFSHYSTVPDATRHLLSLGLVNPDSEHIRSLEDVHQKRRLQLQRDSLQLKVAVEMSPV